MRASELAEALIRCVPWLDDGPVLESTEHNEDRVTLLHPHFVLDDVRPDRLVEVNETVAIWLAPKPSFTRFQRGVFWGEEDVAVPYVGMEDPKECHIHVHRIELFSAKGAGLGNYHKL